MKVYKFGGASVRDADGIRNVADIVQSVSDDLIVVVSAMGKTTNALERVVDAVWNGQRELEKKEIENLRTYHMNIICNLFPTGYAFLANKVDNLFLQLQDDLKKAQNYSYDQFYDQIVSYGEIISTRIVSVYLNRVGVDCNCVYAPSLLRTDSTYREARVDMTVSALLLQGELPFSNEHRNIFVVQGFIGGTIDGLRTTLGREGSDYSAALFANLLNAESVTIWKDVPGILNADPRLVENTVLIPELTYYDAVELAYSGAQVIHPKTIRPLENKQIPLYVRPFSHHDESGSVIKATTAHPINVPVYIWRKNQVLVTVRPKDFAFVLEECLSHLFEVIHSHRLKVSLIQSSAVTISVCVDDSSYLQAAIAELQADYKVSFNVGLSLLTIRGTTPEILAREKQNREILLSQTTRRTARLVVRVCEVK